MNDLTFFTNEENTKLEERFKILLKSTSQFDVIVGYFRTSGFYKLCDSLENCEKIRIIVGLNVDLNTYRFKEIAQNTIETSFSTSETKSLFSEQIINEMENSKDEYKIENGILKFIEFIKTGKLEIRAYPDHRLHAKVYIHTFKDYPDAGRVITGSSNFSESGFSEQLEFNVELKNRADYDYAKEKFEELWENSVELTEDYVQTINNKTWINDSISPYKLYLKFLYEYFKEDINIDKHEVTYLPEGFMKLKYQEQAAVQAKKILDIYGGVFLADVVGLGKTFISALLAQKLQGKILIICPPHLKDYWESTFMDFRVPAKVESIGKIKSIEGDFDFIFVDEAHRFRNQNTNIYTDLHTICYGKKVILVTATPLNNSVNDIYNQLLLFNDKNDSKIPGIPNLEKYFKNHMNILNNFEKGSTDYISELKIISADIREKILKYVMVRRTRTEIKKYYSEDINKQGLTFPELDTPKRIIYEFDEKIESVFNETLVYIQKFKYTRYLPTSYIKDEIKMTDKNMQVQREINIGSFMKIRMLKRLESSFFAFKNTINRMIISYENFIDMFLKGEIFICKNIDIYSLLEMENDEKINQLIEEDKLKVYDSNNFKKEFYEELTYDLEILKSIQILWQSIGTDPKIEEFKLQLNTNSILEKKKIIVFTESKETGQYIYNQLLQDLGSKIMFFSSEGGFINNNKFNKSEAKDIIQNNFDPGKKEKKDIRILITTDVLAEGINLHRSNIIVNYDLPWNPTRVLQRVGRVNRVGSEFDKVYIFNFFPTDSVKLHMNQEAIIKSKLQSFHDALGEDAKYLSDDEEISTHNLFGASLYDKLNNKNTFEDEDEDISELEFLADIRKIRDENPELFNEIKNMPKKARTIRDTNNISEYIKGKFNVEIKEKILLTFFREGYIKKFYLTNGETFKQEIDFITAAKILKSNSEEKYFKKFDEQYYNLLSINKEEFIKNKNQHKTQLNAKVSRNSNEKTIIDIIKSPRVSGYKGFTEYEENYLKKIIISYERGSIPAKISKTIMELLTKTQLEPIKIYEILKENIPSNLIIERKEVNTTDETKKEIILSEYFIKQ